MPREKSFRPDSSLESVALRYPEKTFYLAQVFNDTTTSYKLFWFLAILSRLKGSDSARIPFSSIFTDMVVAAWHPVCLFRLSLGQQDKLQGLVLDVRHGSGLQTDALGEEVRRFVTASRQVQSRLQGFARYVPTRFLSPWYADDLKGVRSDTERTRIIRRKAKDNQNTPLAGPYHFDDTANGSAIVLNDSWKVFFLENLGVIQAFAEYHLALYLQARNPNVPGIVTKLRAPTSRQLLAAHSFWRIVRDRLLEKDTFNDIYSGLALSGRYSIDHFLPWSFVVHDLLWNLAPVEAATNSSKGDSLPDLDLYLPKLARLHFAAIAATKEHPRFLEDYTDIFKVNARGLLELGESGLMARYREVVLPLSQIAVNQGFQHGWRFRG